MKRKAKRRATRTIIPKGYMLVPISSVKTVKSSVMALVKAFTPRKKAKKKAKRKKR